MYGFVGVVVSDSVVLQSNEPVMNPALDRCSQARIDSGRLALLVITPLPSPLPLLQVVVMFAMFCVAWL